MKKFIIPLILILCLSFTLTGYSADLFGTYDQRIKLTIDHSKIDSDLTWFPVTLFMTSTQMEEVFAEFDDDADFDRCAITTSDESTQIYGDCELFDDSESLGIYHVAKTAIITDADADGYLYYYYDKDAAHNTTYISKSGGTAAANVWDYTCVHLMNNLTDSTSNNHTLTAYGAPSVVDTAGGKAYDLDGSTQYFSMADSNDWDFGTGDLTFEAFIDIDVIQNMEMLGFRYTSTNYAPLFRVEDSTGYRILNYMHNSGTIQLGDTVIDTGLTYMVVTRLNNEWMVYLDGVEDDAAWATPGSLNIVATTADIGRYSGDSFYIDGKYIQLRISSVNRNAAWIKATYNSFRDTLLTYGSEEVPAADNAIFFGMAF